MLCGTFWLEPAGGVTVGEVGAGSEADVRRNGRRMRAGEAQAEDVDALLGQEGLHENTRKRKSDRMVAADDGDIGVDPCRGSRPNR